MKCFNSRLFVYVALALFLFQSIFFALYARAAFNVKSVRVLKTNNICIQNSAGEEQALDLSTLITNSDSVEARISSSGALCPTPAFFTGGAKLITTNGISTQAQPVVQGFSRGILISEIAGDTGGISSSGQPTGFNDLVLDFGGTNNLFFEVTLPAECDVIDDDDDAIDSEADLAMVNDFSFPTCSATGGITVACNTASGLLMVTNVLEPASGGNPAKIRYVLSATGSISDINMIDSLLLKLDSQDIFCPSSAMGPLTATVFAKKESITSPTATQTIGTVDLGAPAQAATLSYATEIVTSLKGEVSTNQISSTAVLAPGSTTTANKIEITEIDNESIPVGTLSSAANINPAINEGLTIQEIDIFLIPSKTDLFLEAPKSSDITFSDNTLKLKSDPVFVETTADHATAPLGSIVLKVQKDSGNPSSSKTTISVNNLKLRGISESGASAATDSTISLAFFETNSGAIINTPGVLSIFNSSDTSNPQNFSAFSPNSTRAIRQNEVIGGAINALEGANRIQTNSDLSSLTSRNTTLGAPQIVGFTNVVSEVTPVDTEKISVARSNLVVTVTGDKGAAIGGSKVKIDLTEPNGDDVIDSVTITSKNDGSFAAKLQSFTVTGGEVFKFTQTVSGVDSTIAEFMASLVEPGGLACEDTVCGCEDPNCTPQVVDIVSFVDSKGGLASIVSTGGDLLREVINSIKKALGLT